MNEKILLMPPIPRIMKTGKIGRERVRYVGWIRASSFQQEKFIEILKNVVFVVN